MTVNDVMTRIAQIQGQLTLLGPVRASSSTGAAFADALQAASGPEESSGDAIVAEAKKYLGVPYVWGGEDPAKGLDCSGLVQLVFDRLGVDLPRLAGPQVLAGTPVASLAEARPGDLLGFGNPMHHVGIYLGDGMMIDAPRPGKDVRIEKVYETPSHIGRVDVPTAGTTGSTPAAGATGGTGGTVEGVPYAALFNRAGQAHDVDPRLLAAVAKQESGFDPRAVSPAGARGLMQLMPGTARNLGVRDAFDPAQAVDGAARMLHDLLAKFGRTDLALAAYNAGPGAVTRYHGIPPYPETQAYVRHVMATMRAAS